MKKLLQFFRDENNKLSATRLVVILTALVFCTLAITDIFLEMEVHETIYDIIEIIFMFGLGGQAVRTTVKNMKAEKAELQRE